MKTTKLYLTIISLIALLASNAVAAAWTGSTSEPENMKKIDGKPFYVITTADELAWFAAQVNAGESTINAVLGNDIIFGKNTSSRAEMAWTPIGSDDAHAFNGTIDGSGFTIYGLVSGNRKYTGLVGVLGTQGVIKRVFLQSGSHEKSVALKKDTLFLASIVSKNHGEISSCKSADTIRIHGFSGDRSFGSIKDFTHWIVGSIAAINDGGYIYDSKNIGVLQFDANDGSAYIMSGGIAGVNKGIIQGAINYQNVQIKINYNFIWTEIFNNGYVTYEGWFYYGGVVGLNSKGSKIKKSINNGVVNIESMMNNNMVGGIAGSSSNSTIENCINNTLLKLSAIGANAKLSKGEITPSSTATILTSYSSENFKYYIKNTEVQGTAENMQKDQFAWMLNTTNGTEENSGVWTRGTDGYPTFANEDSLPIYKVVFNDDGVTSNRYTNYKGLATFPDNPEPAENFIFKGWYNSEDVKVKPSTIFTADQTVNAVYVEASDVYWTINFFNTDSKTTLLQTKQYQHGSIVSYEGDVPIKETTAQYTYTFKGWDVEPTNAVEDFDYHAVYDSTLRSYKITFNNYDGSKIENGTFEYGTTPSCSKTPTRTSTVEWTYSHKGWRPAIDVVTGDAAYTAIYDSAKVKYKVTFMNGTAVINEQMVAYGDAAIAPTNVVREGYKFVGWNTSYAKVTEELVVKALFEELIIRKISVIDESGKNIENTEVGDGEKYILPEAPAKEGYSFDGWYNGNTKLGIAGDEITVIADITITAKYTVKSFVIVFVNESDTLQKTSVKYGETPVYTGKTPTKPSTAQYTYTFANWTPSITTVKGDATYKATFIGVMNLYKVTFLDFDGSVLKSQEVKYGSAATAPIEPQRDGYKFLGWDKNFDKVVSNLEVTALFEKNSSSSSTMSSSSEVVSSSSREESSSSDGGEALEFAPIIPQFSVQVFARNVQIAGAKTGSYYAVFDMQGRVIVASQKVVAANFNFALPQSGNYLIKIGSQVRKINVK